MAIVRIRSFAMIAQTVSMPIIRQETRPDVRLKPDTTDSFKSHRKGTLACLLHYLRDD